MNPEQAEHISLLAAPIYAAFLARVIASRSDNDISPQILSGLREHAITQAHALWLDTLDTRE